MNSFYVLREKLMKNAGLEVSIYCDTGKYQGIRPLPPKVGIRPSYIESQISPDLF
jgi:hypothetical protein